MFQRILVPLDESALAECVLPHVAAVAQISGAQVILLRVLEDKLATPAAQPQASDPLQWEISKTKAGKYLSGVSARLQEAGISSQAELLEGESAECVINYVRDHDIDLIILSSHGQSGISGWHLGGIGQKVVLRAHVAIMIVRAYQTAPEDITARYRKLLVPLDGSPRAECVLLAAKSIAQRHQAELILAHVVVKPEMPRRAPLNPDEIELTEKLIEYNQREARHYLDELGGQLASEGLMVGSRLLVSDNVAKALHDLTEQEEADLVILSAHGCCCVTKWPFGGTVINFITYGNTPLLVVQDLAIYELEPSWAELAAKEHKGH